MAWCGRMGSDAWMRLPLVDVSTSVCAVSACDDVCECHRGRAAHNSQALVLLCSDGEGHCGGQWAGGQDEHEYTVLQGPVDRHVQEDYRRGLHGEAD